MVRKRFRSSSLRVGLGRLARNLVYQEAGSRLAFLPFGTVSSDGRALPLQGRGRGFDPLTVHLTDMTPLRLVPTLITVDRTLFRAVLWKMKGNEYRRAKRYLIAVGAEGHTTPAGMYFVNNKSRTPDWRAPDAEWVAPEDRGKIFHFEDSKNPFAGGFISIGGDGVGFHGTKFDPKLGTRASHGCMRMDTQDFLGLYGRVSQGTPVFIY